MSWIWVKLVSGVIFVLVPGFTLKENYHKHPFLTVVSITLGLFLLFLSLKPLVKAADTQTKNSADKKLEEIEVRLNNFDLLDEEQKTKIRKLEKEAEMLKAEKQKQEVEFKIQTIKNKRDNEIEQNIKIISHKKNTDNFEKVTKYTSKLKEKNDKKTSERKLIHSRYYDNKDGSITDTKTHLTWKKCSEGLHGDVCNNGKAKMYNWNDANKMSYVANGKEWRIPTRTELRSLVTCSNGTSANVAWQNNCHANSSNEKSYIQPTVDAVVFPKTANSGYWSRTSSSKNSKDAWSTYFYSGREQLYNKSHTLFVRLVHSRS